MSWKDGSAASGAPLNKSLDDYKAVMQFFSIAWRILVNLATGAVILAMFHVANSRFETIVVSALVLI